MKSRYIWLFLGLFLVGSPTISPAQAPKDPVYDPTTGNVTWGGDTTDKHPVSHDIPAAYSEYFAWTNGKTDPLTKQFIPDPDYVPFNRADTTKATTYNFYRPNDPGITDWVQTVTDTNGHSNTTHGGNIQHHSPWAFYPLDQLPAVDWRIPDFGPTSGPSGLTIYAAVNLGLYFATNPNGPLNGQYQLGETLDQLGLQIVDGQIPGIQGLYFATTDFTLDPNSATGYVPIGGASAWLDSDSFQAANGPIAILGIHFSVPEPSALMLSAIGALCLLGYTWHRRRGPAGGRCDAPSRIIAD